LERKAVAKRGGCEKDSLLRWKIGS